MIFADYLQHETGMTTDINEALVKVGPDIHDGKIRHSHYETNSKDKKVVKNTDGSYRAEFHSKASQRLMHLKALLAARLRRTEKPEIDAKRKKAYMLRRVNGIQQQNQVQQH